MLLLRQKGLSWTQLNPFTFSLFTFHSSLKIWLSWGEHRKGVHLRSAMLRQKKRQVSTCRFFNEINPLRDLWNALRAWNTLRVWNACGRGRIYFISHCDKKVQYFTISARKLFHIRQRRIFHWKPRRFKPKREKKIVSSWKKRVLLASGAKGQLKSRYGFDFPYRLFQLRHHNGGE